MISAAVPQILAALLWVTAAPPGCWQLETRETAEAAASNETFRRKYVEFSVHPCDDASETVWRKNAQHVLLASDSHAEWSGVLASRPAGDDRLVLALLEDTNQRRELRLLELKPGQPWTDVELGAVFWPGGWPCGFRVSEVSLTKSEVLVTVVATVSSDQCDCKEQIRFNLATGIFD